jgi:hypothetical protein
MSPNDIPEDGTLEYEIYEDEDTPSWKIEERENIDQKAIHRNLHAEVNLPIAGEFLSGKVTRRKRDADGNLTGKAAANPICGYSNVVTIPKSFRGVEGVFFLLRC